MARVLIVDDDRAIRYVVTEALARAGLEPVADASGRAALERLESGERPDAIVMDLMMQGMSGEAFLETLQTRRRWAKIPVVLLSGAVLSERTLPPPDRYRVALRKPFDVNELVAEVTKCLEGGAE